MEAGASGRRIGNGTSSHTGRDRGPTGAMTAVECIGLALTRAGRPALAGLDWRIAPGELQVIAGPTGAGKSALLAVAGLALPPSGGQLRLFGAPVPPPSRAAEPARAALRRRIGRAEARPAFLDHLSLAENVALPLRLAGRGPADRAAQAGELLDWLGLGPRADDPPSALSDGERRRAGLARAVIAGPELILADEPSSDLDREGAAQALEMLAALAAHGAAVAIATGDADLVRLARHHSEARILTLTAGRFESPAA